MVSVRTIVSFISSFYLFVILPNYLLVVYCEEEDSEDFIDSGTFILHRTSLADDQYLLFKEKQKQKWSLLEGLCQDGESAFDAALRELHNKTGLTSADIIIIPEVEKLISYEKESRTYFNSYFVATMKDPEKKILLAPKFQKYQWMSIKEATNSAGNDFADTLQHIHDFVVKTIN